MPFNNLIKRLAASAAVTGIVLPLVIMVSLAVAGIMLTQPVGGISGRVSVMNPDNTGLSTYDMRSNKVYAMVSGPRSRNGYGNEQGVWVNSDGSFTIPRLPVGEYNLLIKAPNFETINEYAIQVNEGEVTKIAKSLTLNPLNPYVSIASNTRVFTTKEAPHFWINASGSTHASVKLYKTDLKPIVSKRATRDMPFYFGSSLNLYVQSPTAEKAFAGQTPVTTFERKLVMDRYDSARSEFKLDNPLEPGDYVAAVSVNNDWKKTNWNVFWFTVTDMGIIVKHAPNQTLVRAIDLNTLKPRAGVAVSFVDIDNQAQFSAPGTTGSDGFLSFNMPAAYKTQSSYNLVAYGSVSNQHAYGSIPFWSEGLETYRTYFYTERPVYRLGQTVYFKGLTRKHTMNGYVTPNGTPISMTVEDPDGNNIYTGSLKTNDHGSFNGLFKIGESSKTGAYQIVLNYPDGTQDYEAVEVVQYRKPEYQVDVVPLKKRVTAGDTLKTRIKATYFFGAPVTNAKVHYTVYAAPDYSSRSQLLEKPSGDSFFDNWNNDDDESGYAGDYITEGYAQLDDNGEALISVKTNSPSSNNEGPMGSSLLEKRYTIQADVTDLSRMTVVGNGTAQVTPGDFAILLQPRSNVVKTGEKAVVAIQALTFEGKPVANQTISVDVKRWVYNDKNARYREHRIHEGLRATTNDKGQAELTFDLPGSIETDNYTIIASSKDRNGNRVASEDSLWIANYEKPFSVFNHDTLDQEPLALHMAKPVYHVGDTAKVMVTAPVDVAKTGPIDAIVAIEGPKLYTYKLVKLSAPAQLVELPITAEYAPNVFVTVSFAGDKHQFYTQSEEIKVSPADHFLKLAITSDKETYKPGETVQYTIKATKANGEPAANTELSLGVVDESIYSIRPESAQDMRKFFYNARENTVVTASSFPEEYSGGPDKIEPRVRKDFRDVAGWQPVLVTNAQGIATTSVKLPDNLTTWRATVRAISANTDVGSTLQKVIATQDFLVRLALPRFYTQGDEATITAIVHNYTDSKQDVNVTLKTDGPGEFEIKKPLETTLKVDPEKAERYTWPVKAVAIGKTTIGIKAVGQTDGDAMETTLAINPLGIEKVVNVTTRLTGETDRWQTDIRLPQNVDPKTAHYALSLGSSSIGAVLVNLDQLLDYPYGCVEQTMSRLMPAVLAMTLEDKLHATIPAEAKAKFPKIYQEGMAKLYSAQSPSGGWGWWQYDDANLYLTSYVMEGFYRLTQIHYTVDADRLEQGKKRLESTNKVLLKQLQDPKLVINYNYHDSLIDMAYSRYVLSLWDVPFSKPDAEWLVKAATARPKSPKDRPSWSPEALSYLTLSYLKSGYPSLARQTYKRLAELGYTHNDLRNWEHDKHLYKAMGLQQPYDYSYRFTGTEATALALRATLAIRDIEPDVMADATAAHTWLLMQRDKDGWNNTKTTAQVMRALMEYELAAGQDVTTDFTVASTMSELINSTLSFDEASRGQADRVFTLAGNEIKALTNSIVNLTKSGSGRLYVNSLLTYMLPLKPGQKVNEPSYPEGLAIKREFYHLVPKVSGSDGQVHYKPIAIGSGEIKAGEIVLMKVNINSPIELPYVMVQAALPSGGEVISEDDPRAALTDSGTTRDSWGDWDNWWWSHRDVLDDRLVFFATHLPRGKSTFYALVRMELPGRFQLNPVQLTGMYSKKVRAISSLDSLAVNE